MNDRLIKLLELEVRARHVAIGCTCKIREIGLVCG